MDEGHGETSGNLTPGGSVGWTPQGSMGLSPLSLGVKTLEPFSLPLFSPGPSPGAHSPFSNSTVLP